MRQADWHKENFLTESQKDNKTKSWNSFIKKCPERQSKQEAKGYWSEKGMSWEKASKDRMAFQNKMNMEMLMSLWLLLPGTDSEWHHDLVRPHEASIWANSFWRDVGNRSNLVKKHRRITTQESLPSVRQVQKANTTRRWCRNVLLNASLKIFTIKGLKWINPTRGRDCNPHLGTTIKTFFKMRLLL